MANASFDDCERILDLEQYGLGSGLAVWKVHISLLREQRKNARYMEPDTFKQLRDNIQDTDRLESLVFAYLWDNPGGNKEFLIISGHHRTRAARDAGVEWMPVLVDETDLSTSEIKSKQLAHNALSGQDDPQVLKEIYQDISDIDARIASGIDEQDFDDLDIDAVSIDNPDFMIDYETVDLHFLPSDFEDFDRLINELDQLDVNGIVDYVEFEPFQNLVNKISAEYDVRNMTAIIVKMMELCNRELDRIKAAEKLEAESEADDEEGENPDG